MSERCRKHSRCLLFKCNGCGVELHEDWGTIVALCRGCLRRGVKCVEVAEGFSVQWTKPASSPQQKADEGGGSALQHDVGRNASERYEHDAPGRHLPDGNEDDRDG
jgi:hypothetical protein